MMNYADAGFVLEQMDEPQSGLMSDGPAVPPTLEETGLSSSFVSDLLLKTMYVQGARTGDRLARFIRLPFPILDEELLTLQQRRLVEVRGTQGKGRRGYTFDLTEEGRTRCRELLLTNRYVGPAPVTLESYQERVDAQKVQDAEVDAEQVRGGFRHLVLEEDFMEALGPGINSGKSLFLYGHAGNGKTVIAEAIAGMLGDAVYVPYAVEVEGQIIAVFDPVVHQEVEPSPSEHDTADPSWVHAAPTHDQRWVRIRRPFVMVGGELTLDDLELQFDRQAGVFRAPPQVKANGGVFIIDDFGRQRLRPRDLLNRWMVPLEKHQDFLSLPMGHKLPVPFECLLIFATNLDPTELVEEAFLRRIRYKVLVDNPDRERYTEIFRRACESREIPFAPEAVDLVYEEYYGRPHLHPRCCHPRDIANHIRDIARYAKVEPSLSDETLRQACDSYFLDMPDADADAEPPAPRRDLQDGQGLPPAEGGLSHWRERGKWDGGMYDG